MRKIVIFVVLISGGCKKTNWNKVTSDMEDLRDKLCACRSTRS